MDAFTLYLPTMYVFGADREKEAGALAKKFGATKVLLVYGGQSAEKSGLLDRVRASLTAEGLGFINHGGVRPNPRSGLVYQGIEICRKEGVDFVLAVGGGSSIDTAKAIALGVPYDGDFWDFYMGKAEPKTALPVGTVLTIAAAGSEGSGDTVIAQENGMLKYGYGNDLLRPRFSILNPKLTLTLPIYQTACGIVDIMAHIFERYFTNTPDVEVSDHLCEGLLMTMLDAGKKIMEDPQNEAARATIMWAGTVAHNNICGVGREQDWSSHNLEHSLSAQYDCAHGAGLAVMMPAWMQYVMNHDVNRFCQLATRVFGCEMDFKHPERTAKAGIQALQAFWKSLGMPSDFAGVGAKEEDIPHLLDHLGLDGGTMGGFVHLDRAACEKIYRIAVKGAFQA